jgi:hypothetical protein
MNNHTCQSGNCESSAKGAAGLGLRVAFLVLLTFALFHHAAHAYELQIKTGDGQTVTGEYLGTEDGVIRLRTKYGPVSIPQKDVTSMSRPEAAPAQPGDSKKPPVPTPDEGPAPTFPEPKDVSLSALIASRVPDPPEPTKQERQEIFRLIRNFRDSSDKSRDKSLAALKNFGEKAYPFIASAYTAADELDDRISLFSAMALPNSPYTAGAFSEAHAAALKAFEHTSEAPPPPPPDYTSKLDRAASRNPGSDVKAAAANVLAIEADASIAGGPFNTLFLFQTYKKRYSGETDALLKNANRDKALLASAAGDAQKSKTEWIGADRVMLAEQALPLLFKDNDELSALARELLKKILPSGHPKFEASQEEWLTWWTKNKDKIEKK